MSGPLLEIKGLSAGYGPITVLFDVSLTVNPGEAVALLGRNGTGKTTTLRSIMGLTDLRAGEVVFKGQRLNRRPPFEVARLGVGFVPDDRRIFGELTVEDNLLLPTRWVGRRNGFWALSRVYDLFPVLAQFRKLRAGALSGGQQKMLAIGRALMLNPELLLLDEAAEGLGPIIVAELVKALAEVRASGIAILLADQNLHFARRVADRAYIIDRGTTPVSAPMAEILANEELIRQYLTV